MCDFLQYSWTCPDLKSFKTTESSFITFFTDYEQYFLFNHIQSLFDFGKSFFLVEKLKTKQMFGSFDSAVTSYRHSILKYSFVGFGSPTRNSTNSQSLTMFSAVKCCIAGGGWGNTASRLRPAAHLPDHSNRAWSLVGTRDILAETMHDMRREEQHSHLLQNKGRVLAQRSFTDVSQSQSEGTL